MNRGKFRDTWNRLMRFSLLLLLTGCCSVQPVIPPPNCDQPIPVTQEIWDDILLLRENYSENALIYQQCIQRYKARIEALNGE